MTVAINNSNSNNNNSNDDDNDNKNNNNNDDDNNNNNNMDYVRIVRNDRIGQIILGSKSGPIQIKHWNEKFAKSRQPVAKWHNNNNNNNNNNNSNNNSNMYLR